MFLLRLVVFVPVIKVCCVLCDPDCRGDDGGEREAKGQAVLGDWREVPFLQFSLSVMNGLACSAQSESKKQEQEPHWIWKMFWKGIDCCRELHVLGEIDLSDARRKSPHYFAPADPGAPPSSSPRPPTCPINLEYHA
jgi:hypothetical protein